MQNRTVNDRWSKKLEKSSNELKEDIDKVKNFQISSSDKNTPIINNEPIWKHYYNEGRQIEFSFRQSQTKGCFIPKVSSKKGEIDSFLKIKEYIEETNVRKVIVADPFFSIVSSEKFMARISRSDVEILIITSLTDIDPDTGSNIDILTQYKKHLRLNSNILHKNTEIYNVAHSGNQAFHDRYLIRYFDDNTIDGFMLSNSLNSAGQNYSFVVAPLEKEVCFSVEEYLNKLIDINYQSNKPKLERLSIEKIFPLNNPVNNKKPIKNTLLFPSFISGEKDSESALKYCVEKGFIDEIKDNEHYCQVNNPKQCYYIWLQEYINVRLNYDNPDWRNQQTNTLYFPKENILGSEKSKEHLKYIAGFPKFKASWLQYYLCLDELNNLPRSYNYDDMDKQAIDYIIKPALDKLEEGKKTVKNIPKRFIPDCYEKAIQIGNDILNYTEKPDYMKFFSFISMCQDIHASIGMIALTFDASHMRIFYESENGSRY